MSYDVVALESRMRCFNIVYFKLCGHVGKMQFLNLLSSIENIVFFDGFSMSCSAVVLEND